ncbi:MAG: tetratricopeptide repeat protein [Puniceicoccales bacterium]|jgi:tetratricopeptide (TPR) repeat protein|nr:tetratricopeptide repeat protein [Puniceicoccales bacterium]
MKQIAQFVLAFFKITVSKGMVCADPQAACDHAALLADSGRFRRARMLLTSVISAPDTPVHVRVRALRMRASIHMRRQATLPNALSDLAAILELPDIEGPARAEMLLLRARVLERMENLSSAIESCSAVIHMEAATPEQILSGYGARALLRRLSGDNEGALSDYAAILSLPQPPPHEKALALNNRHVIHQELGETQAAIADLSDLIGMPDIAPEVRVLSLLYRGQLFEADRLLRLAVADYSAALMIPEIPAALRREAFALRASVFRRTGCGRRASADEGFLFATSGLWRNIRVGAVAFAILSIPFLWFLERTERSFSARFREGVAQAEAGEYASAFETFGEVIGSPDADDETKTRAHLERGRLYQKTGRHRQMLADFAAAMQRPGVSPRVKVEALLNQGFYNRERSDWKAAIADFSKAADFASGADLAALRGMAIFARAECHEMDGAHKAALADYTTLANMDAISSAQRALVLLNRGNNHRSVGDRDKAAADYAEVLKIQSAAVGTHISALLNRGLLHLQHGDSAKALEAFDAAIAVRGSENSPLADEVRHQRALVHFRLGQNEEALADLDEIVDTPGISVETRRRALALRREIHAGAGNAREAAADARELQSLQPVSPPPPAS